MVCWLWPKLSVDGLDDHGDDDKWYDDDDDSVADHDDNVQMIVHRCAKIERTNSGLSQRMGT